MTHHYTGPRHLSAKSALTSVLTESLVAKDFSHCRLKFELISASDVSWTVEYLSEGFVDGCSVGPEVALLTHRLLRLTLGGWKLHLRERAFRCVTGEICIPFH